MKKFIQGFAIVSTSDSWGGLQDPIVFLEEADARAYLEKELNYDMFLYDNFDYSSEEVFDKLDKSEDDYGRCLDIDEVKGTAFCPRLNKWIDVDELYAQASLHIVECKIYGNLK